MTDTKITATIEPDHLRKIMRFLTDLESGNFTTPLTLDGCDKTIHPLIDKLNAVATNLNPISQSDARRNITNAIDAMTKMASLNFDIDISCDTGDDLYDAFATGLLMLSEELKHSLVKRELLEDANFRKNRLLENMREAVYELDKDGKVIYCNPAAEQLSGMSLDAMKGVKSMALAIVQLPDGQFLDPDQTPSVLVRRTGKKTSAQTIKFVNKENQLKWASILACPISWENDKVANVMLVMTDTSEIEIAKAHLKEERDKFKRLFDSLNNVALVSLTDPHGVILEANDKFCEISGYTQNELIGKTHRIIKSGQHPPSFYHDMWKTILSKRPWRGEVCNRAKGGSLYWVDSTIIPLLDSAGNITNFFSIRYDVTARKIAEAALVHTAKMASLGEMAGGIAHEINNPIAIIEGSADRILKLLKREPLDVQSIETFAQSILETSGRVAEIVTGLRTLSRNADADPHIDFKVAELLDDVLALARERLSHHGINLHVDSEPHVSIQGNKTQLAQVLLNLINNADDALIGTTRPWINIDAKTVGVKVEITVTDSGKGIPKHIQERLFVPFFTTKPPGKGTGLGLSLSRKILEQHHGELILDASCPNTRFVLQLPCSRK